MSLSNRNKTLSVADRILSQSSQTSNQDVSSDFEDVIIVRLLKEHKEHKEK
jgi:hypothetical protein